MRLEYEAYTEMAEKEMLKICDTVLERGEVWAIRTIISSRSSPCGTCTCQGIWLCAYVERAGHSLERFFSLARFLRFSSLCRVYL